MFAADYLTTKPDIICLAKSLTGGYLPLVATVFTKKIHDEFFGEMTLTKHFCMVIHSQQILLHVLPQPPQLSCLKKKKL